MDDAEESSAGKVPARHLSDEAESQWSAVAIASLIAERDWFASERDAAITAQVALMPPLRWGEVLRRQMARLPRLGSDQIETVPCKICAFPAAEFDVVDFNKVCHWDLYPFGLARIPVEYYRCGVCSFMFTTFFDSWSTLDFSQFVYNEDYVIVDPEYEGARAARTAADISRLLRGCEGAWILDYGSGSGRFAAEMKARGFGQISSYDPFSAPERPRGLFDIITCFEALEHTVAPRTAFDDMVGFLAADGAIIVGQTLQPSNIREIRGNWWYVAPRNGHVSMFAEDTFHLIADRLGLRRHSVEGLYGFARPTAGGALAAALARLGPVDIRLCAPAQGGEGWGDPELLKSITRFRWTCSPEIVWPLRRFAPGRTRIRIPYLMQNAPGFAENSRVFIGETPLPSEATADAIIALAEFPEATAAQVRLVTPEPPSAEERGTPHDRRNLGLAVPTAL